MRSPSVLPVLVAMLASAGCQADAAPVYAQPTARVLTGAHVVGQGVVDVQIDEGLIQAVGDTTRDLPQHDLSGLWVVPAFIDSHVHLVYDPRGAEMVAGGIAGAVDWAAPLGRMTAPDGPTVHWSGPMITSVGGYPTQGWGRDGYGMEVRDASEASLAVDQLHTAGARVIKMPIEAGGLSDELIVAVVSRAHEHGMQVGAHAMADRDVRRAADLGVDVLVHAPRGPLAQDTINAWSGRAFVPTVSAFSGTDTTRALIAAGATPLYGTDFGNTRTAGISRAELQGMLDAGMDGAAIIAAGTADPAAFFSFDELGTIQPGKQASLLILNADPLVEPLTLANPVAVLIKGQVVHGALPSAAP